jgi:hypothetical protein
MSNLCGEKITALKIMDPLFMTPEAIEALRKKDVGMEIDKLTSKKPEEAKEAAEELGKLVKDERLKRELDLVRGIAIRRITIEKIGKEFKKST